jgi:hypothetical protein
VHINPLFLKPCSRQVFLPFVKEHFPHLVKLYDERYGNRDFATPEYSKRVGELTRKLCVKYGVGRRRQEKRFSAPEALRGEEQMGLF